MSIKHVGLGGADLFEVSVLHGLLDGAQSLLEQVVVQLLKTGTRQGLAQVHSLRQGLNLHADLHCMSCIMLCPELRVGLAVASSLRPPSTAALCSCHGYSPGT